MKKRPKSTPSTSRSTSLPPYLPTSPSPYLLASLSSAVRTEGGLLPQDLLARIQGGDPGLPGTKAETYHLGPHERIGEAANRSWSRLVATWRAFQEALQKAPETSLATGLTRDRWLLPLFQELGYGRLPKGRAIEVDGKSFAVSHTWHHSPIHLLGCRVDLESRQKGVAGAAKSSPHGLVQEFLNRSDDYLWGFVTNGYRLRVLRDHHSLTRQAYVEFDLQTIMDGEQYSGFLLLWLVCHQSRVEAEKPLECWLETWLKTSRDEGVRALDKLRVGVERAIESFGTGFLAHRANAPLKAALSSGELDKQDYYRQILRLVYRLIFLFVAEERGALLDPASTREARGRYRRYYATRRLRVLADKRRGGPHGDLWRGLALVMEKLDDGYPPLGLPALGSRLFGPTACPQLMRAECANEHVLTAIRHLSHIQEGKTRYPVNWRNVGADELGSVYESLLERHPRIHKDAATFVLETAAGHERKTTGSYYTPTSLVDCLLDSALDPVLAEACKKPDPEAAILDLKVCDPACGSGHFLVAAARRIAKRLASVRSGDDEPSPREVQKALRDVVGRCIFGVDLNPMAVELCKVSLWMEAIEPGRPLSFLDSHIQCGNALLGATPALMARGIPNEAFKPIEGDDREVAKRLKKRNRKERKSKQRGFVFPAPIDKEILDEFTACDEGPDFDLSTTKKHETCWLNLQRSSAFRDAWFRADAWCASFVWPKQPGELERAAITEGLWRQIQRDVTAAPQLTRKTVRQLSRQYRFFHWQLAFPQVFGDAKPEVADDETTGWTGGFDVVLGNPPWERIKLQEKEFFSARAPEIMRARNAAVRKKAIARLEAEDPALWDEWKAALREADGASHLVRTSGRYPLCGRGDINTYSIFAELNRGLLSGIGRSGFVVPSGIATDATTQFFFRSLVGRQQLVSIFSFENEEFLFSEVHNQTKFCLLTLSGQDRRVAQADLVFFVRQARYLRDAERHFWMSSRDFALINPNTFTCPTFRSRRDAEITKHVYCRVPVLVREATAERPEENPWGVSFRAMLHMANDSGLFRTREELEAEGWQLRGNVFERDGERLLPLYEAKMVHHFDHRYAGLVVGDAGSRPSRKFVGWYGANVEDPSDVPIPRYWVAESEVEARLQGRWDRGWLLGWRDITNAVNERTAIASVVPRVGTGDTYLLAFPAAEVRFGGYLAANLCSFALDFAARQKVGGTHVKYHTFKQLPVLAPATYSRPCPWSSRGDLAAWLRPRVLELTYTAWDLASFARDQGYSGPPFRWDEARRFLLRAELDAAFFHLYLGTPIEWRGTGSPELLDAFPSPRDAVDYIMETFPIVKRKDIAAHGNYRTKAQILHLYDAMQRAIDTDTPYQTLLDPPPADPRVAHSEDTRPAWAPVEAEEVQALPALAYAAALPDGAWARPLVDQRGESAAAIAAVLKALGRAAPARTVRLAGILVLEPRLAIASFDVTESDLWRRVVGSEADPLPAGVTAFVPAADHAWGAAMRQLRGSGLLIEDTTTNTWAPGPGLDEIVTDGWPDGRAKAVLGLLRSRDAHEVVRRLPETLRRWIVGAAA